MSFNKLDIPPSGFMLWLIKLILVAIEIGRLVGNDASTVEFLPPIFMFTVDVTIAVYEYQKAKKK